MKYTDKSTGRVTDLRPSNSDFLVLTKKDDSESVRVALDSGLFAIRRSTNDDGVILLKLRSQAESLTSINQALTDLQNTANVSQVVPAGIDQQGVVRHYLPDRVVIQVRPEHAGEVPTMLDQSGSKVLRRFRSEILFEAAVPAGSDVESFIATLNADNRVVMAEPAFYGVDDHDVSVRVTVLRGPAAVAEAEEVAAEWNVALIRAPEAWTVTRGSPDIVVAIVDGMPQLDHPALAGKFLLPAGDEYVFCSDTSVSSHATNIASLIAGGGDRITGIAPGVRLTPVVVNLNSQSYSERADAIRYVSGIARTKTIGAHPISRVVMSCSWRTQGDVGAVRLALQDAVANGVVVVFSAGNDGDSSSHFPSDYATGTDALGQALISVAATDRADHKASYSNFSPAVTLCAPGGDGLPLDDRDILCADQNGAYAFAAGTSIAAPHVSAVASLMLSLQADLDPSDVKGALRRSSDDIRNLNPGFDNMLGAGRLDAATAIGSFAGPAGGNPNEKPGTSGTGSGPTTSGTSPGPGSPQGGSGPQAASYPVLTVSATVPPADSVLILRSLHDLQQELLARTGWLLAEARVEKNDSGATFDLRPAN